MAKARLAAGAWLMAAVLAAGPAVAADEPAAIERTPGAALAAAAANIVFVPVRLALTVAGAELGGVTGFLTAGNQRAAEDVWWLFRGQSHLTPEFVRGEEPLQVGAMEFRR